MPSMHISSLYNDVTNSFLLYRNMSQSFAAGSRKYSETVNAESLCRTPSINSKPTMCIEK